MFLASHPAAAAFLATPKPVVVSYGTQPFFGVNALKFTNAQGVSKFGRYRIVPESGPASYVSDDEAANRACVSNAYEIGSRSKCRFSG
jgi:catalase